MEGERCEAGGALKRHRTLTSSGQDPPRSRCWGPALRANPCSPRPCSFPLQGPAAPRLRAQREHGLGERWTQHPCRIRDGEQHLRRPASLGSPVSGDEGSVTFPKNGIRVLVEGRVSFFIPVPGDQLSSQQHESGFGAGL